MAFQKPIKIRILFDLGEGFLRQFYWFKKHGNDFYWGNCTRGPFIAKHFHQVDKATVEVPGAKDFEKIDVKANKFSYHATGQVHQTIEGNLKPEFLSKWPKIADLKEPQCIYTVISRHFAHYPKYEGGFKKRNTANIILKMHPTEANTRHVFEFWVSSMVVPLTTKHRIVFPAQLVNAKNVRLDSNLYLFFRSSLLLDEQKLSPRREMGLFQFDPLK